MIKLEYSLPVLTPMRPPHPFRVLSLGLAGLMTMLLSPLPPDPSRAHTIAVDGDIAATFHLEPHHNPKVGQPAQVWFALTFKGGHSVPLAQCDCQLAVYPDPRPPAAKPLMQPTLKPLAVESYQGIPGSEVIFPTVGAYQLELSGKPKAGGVFKPFKLLYSVIVIP